MLSNIFSLYIPLFMIIVSKVLGVSSVYFPCKKFRIYWLCLEINCFCLVWITYRNFNYSALLYLLVSLFFGVIFFYFGNSSTYPFYCLFLFFITSIWPFSSWVFGVVHSIKKEKSFLYFFIFLFFLEFLPLFGLYYYFPVYKFLISLFVFFLILGNIIKLWEDAEMLIFLFLSPVIPVCVLSVLFCRWGSLLIFFILYNHFLLWALYSERAKFVEWSIEKVYLFFCYFWSYLVFYFGMLLYFFIVAIWVRLTH